MSEPTLKPFTGKLDDNTNSKQQPALKPFTGALDGEDKGFLGQAKDHAVSFLGKGTVGVGEVAVGLSDMMSDGATGKILSEKLGYDPKAAKNVMTGWQSEQYQQQLKDSANIGNRKIEEGDDFATKVGKKFDNAVDITKNAISNPSLITNTVAESLPSMFLGGVLGRASGIANPVVAGAVGEGAVMAGSQAEQIRQETVDGRLTADQSLASVGTGALGGLFGYAGGRLAQKMGLSDVDTAMQTGRLTTQQVGEEIAKTPMRAIPTAVIKGAISEGFLEELPQSVSEQILQNLALDKPWHDGVENAAVMGALAGMAMGGTVSGVGKTGDWWNSRSDTGSQDNQQQSGSPNLPSAPSQFGSNPDSALTGEYIPRGNVPQGDNQGRTAFVYDQPSMDADNLLNNNGFDNTATSDAPVNPNDPDTPPAPNGNYFDNDYGSDAAFDDLLNAVPPTGQTPSQQMGIDPNAGPMSSAAALAVDSGASPVAQLGYTPTQQTQEQSNTPISDAVPSNYQSLLGSQNDGQPFDARFEDATVQQGNTQADNTGKSISQQYDANAADAMGGGIETDRAKTTTAQTVQPILGQDGKNKWFGSQEKAQAFIDKKDLGNDYQVVQDGKRFEIQPKAKSPVQDDAYFQSKLDQLDKQRAQFESSGDYASAEKVYGEMQTVAREWQTNSSTGAPTTKRAEPSKGASDNAWGDFYRKNRNMISEELFMGGHQDRNTLEEVAPEIQSRHAHGMAKATPAASVRDLKDILENDIDQNRGQGRLFTAPLSQGKLTAEQRSAMSASGTSSGSAYSDGAFTLIAKEGVGDIRSVSEIDAVMVNSAVPQEVVNGLRQDFPNMKFGYAKELPNLLSGGKQSNNAQAQVAELEQQLKNEKIVSKKAQIRKQIAELQNGLTEQAQGDAPPNNELQNADIKNLADSTQETAPPNATPNIEDLVSVTTNDGETHMVLASELNDSNVKNLTKFSAQGKRVAVKLPRGRIASTSEQNKQEQQNEAPAAQPVSAKGKNSDNKFQKYDDVAKQYGRSINSDGAILSNKGKDTGVRIIEKKGRVRIEQADGKLLHSGPNPESLGKFLEDYWYDKKIEPKQEANNQQVNEATKTEATKTEATKTEATQKPKVEVSENKVVTEERRAELEKLIKAKLSQLNSGIDPELIVLGTELALYHIERGVRTFAAYAKAMTESLGDNAKPFLKSWYMGVKYDPRATGFDGMSSAAEVENFDLDDLDLELGKKKETVVMPSGRESDDEASRNKSDLQEDEVTNVEPSQKLKEMMDRSKQRVHSSKQIIVDEHNFLNIGSSILTGQPVYTLWNDRGNYFTVDVDSIKPNATFNQVVIDKARAVKKQEEQRDAELVKKYPNGVFSGTDTQVVTTENVPKKVKEYLGSLLNMLGMDTKVFLATSQDINAQGAQEKYHIYGGHRSILSTQVNAEENGATRLISINQSDFNDAYIALNSGMSEETMIEVIAHELGHLIEKTLLKNASKETLDAIKADFQQWLASVKGVSKREHLALMRNRHIAQMNMQDKASIMDTSNANLSPYWFSFSEWFADQVSRWTTTSEKPLSLVEKFFASVAKKLKQLAQIVNNTKESYQPSVSVRDYLNSIARTDFLEELYPQQSDGEVNQTESHLQENEVTHIEGKKSEKATNSVVEESLDKAEGNLTKAQYDKMRNELIADIEQAIAIAPNDSTEQITFDVKGDGKFKVRNDKPTLTKFLKQVKANAGFKPPVKPKKAGGSTIGANNPINAIKDMLTTGRDEYSVSNAYELAKANDVQVIFSRERNKIQPRFVIRKVADFDGNTFQLAIDIANQGVGYAVVNEHGGPLAFGNTEKAALEKANGYLTGETNQARTKTAAAKYNREVERSGDTQAKLKAEFEKTLDALFGDDTQTDQVQSIQDEDGIARVQEAPQATVDKSEQQPKEAIRDLGEKIGGARKDTALSTGKSKKNKSTDDRPTWAKRYTISEIVSSINSNETGKWVIEDSKKTDWKGSPKKLGMFDSEQEAKDMLPVVAVGLKHRVYARRDGESGFEIWRQINDVKRVKVVNKVFDTKQDAQTYLIENANNILETSTTFGELDLPRPENTERKGIERRKGDAKDTDFMKVFGFRGVEFGNWNNQEERQQLLNDAYDGLLDLAEVLKIPAKAISLNGDLALAFGARGQGLSSARAHYEPAKVVINLTKMNGAGSLAHEWWHAFDHYLARQDGIASAEWVVDADGTRSLKISNSSKDRMVSHGFSYRNSGVREDVRNAYTDLMKTMSTKAEQYVEDVQAVDKFVGQSRDRVKEQLDSLREDLSQQRDPKYYKRHNKPASAEQLVLFDTISQKLINGELLETEWRTDVKNKSAHGIFSGARWTNDALEQLGEIYKSVRGRSGFSKDQDAVLDRLRSAMNSYANRLKMLADAQKEVSKTRKIPTKFVMDAKNLDEGRGSDYWTTPHELSARAFQGFVEDKITENNGRSPFLNHAPENAAIETPWGWMRPYPHGDERKAINAKFSDLVDTLKTEETETGIKLYSRDKLKPDSERKGASPLDTTFTPLSVVSATRRVLSILQHLKMSATQDASSRGRINVSLNNRIGVNKVGNVNSNGFSVQVISSFSDLPKVIQNDATYKDENGKTQSYDVSGVWHDGILYVVADQVYGDSEKQLTTFEAYEELLVHEVIGHLGVQRIFGNEYKTRLQQLYNALGELEGIRKIASKNGVNMAQFESAYIEPYTQGAKERVYAESDVQQALVGELFAFVAQNAKSRPFVRQKLKEVIGYIRQWFRDRGFDKFLSRYNDADLMMFLSEARKAVVDRSYFGKYKNQEFSSKNDSDTPLYSRRTKSNTGSTTQQVRDLLIDRFGKKTIEELESRGLLRIVQSMDDVEGMSAESLMQRAWHGSKHKGIEKNGFKLNKIGVGAGSQAYGYGIYFTQDRSTAEIYGEDGQLYSAEIPNNDELLSWNTPLSEQSKLVQDAINRAFDNLEKLTGKKFNRPGKDAKGRAIYVALMDELGVKGASNALLDAGLSGLRYFDPTSLNDSENFVIWDESYLNQDIQTYYEAENDELAGIEGIYQNGQATLIAGNLTADTIIPTFLHELGGHAGFQNMMTDVQYNELMKQFDKLVEQGNPVAIAAKELAEREQGLERQQLEYLPYLLTLASTMQQKNVLQRNALQKLIRNLISHVKAWLFDKFSINLNLNPDDMVALAERMIDKAANNSINQANTGISFSQKIQSVFTDAFTIAKDEQQRIAKDIDRLIESLQSYPQPVQMKMPPVLLALDGVRDGLNVQDLPLELDRFTLRKMTGQVDGKKDVSHQLTLEQIKQLPNELANPLVILQSDDGRNLTIVTAMQDPAGNPVISAIHLNKQKGKYVINELATTFGRERFMTWLEKRKDKVIYSNSEKSKGSKYPTLPHFLGQLETAHVGVVGTRTSTQTILTPDDVVNFFEQQHQPLYSRKSFDDVINNLSENIKNLNSGNFKLPSMADAMKYGLMFLSRMQITDIYKKILPQLSVYNDLVHQMDADKNDIAAEADNIVREWAKLKDEEALADVMHEATLAQIDPAKAYQPGDDKAKYQQLHKAYNNLSPEAQEMYKKARDAYSKHYAKVREAVRERILRSALSSERKADLLKKIEGSFGQIKGVYFPLARFGQYVVVARNQNGDVESISRAETENEAKALREQLIEKYPQLKVDSVIRDQEYNALRDKVGRGFMSDLFDEVGNLGLDAKKQAEFEDTLGQLYLSSMPDLSWAKHGIHRKGTAGFSNNARRAFAQNMSSGASYLAKLRYGDQLTAQLDEMEEYAKAQIKKDPSYRQPLASAVIDEMNKRHKNLMNAKGNAVSSLLTSMGFIYFLGLSPAAAMVNILQTPLVAYPILGAKFGFDKAGIALLKASADYAKGVGFEMPDFTDLESFRNSLSDSIDPDIAKVLKEHEKQAYEKAVSAGVIDVTQAHDLAGIAQGEDSGVMWKMRPIMRAASLMFHHAERFNREVTFIAAYRLSKESGMADHDAYKQAVKMTYDGHFDYSASNRARFMQGNVAKVIFLFKQFGQNMIYTIARQSYIALIGKNHTKEERIEAARAISAILVTHALAAGVLGLPMVTTLLAVASMFGGGDDDPWDAEVALRNGLADMTSPNFSNLVMKGLSRGTSADLSGRVGLDSMFLARAPDGLEGQKLYEQLILGNMGATVGMGANIAKGIQELGQGNYARALEEMLPTFAKNPFKAYRYATEGVQDKTGVDILDGHPVSGAGIFSQTIGFSPSQVRTAYEGKSAIYQQQQALQKRKSKLTANWVRAKRNDDQEGMDSAWKDIQEFNEVNPKLRINRINLMQSYHKNAKRIRDAENGVYLSKKYRDIGDYGRFAETD